jgi:hypothetical protein
MRRVVEACVQVAERNIQYIEAPLEQVLSFSVDKRADIRVAPGERLCCRYPLASQALPALETFETWLRETTDTKRSQMGAS